MTENCQQATVLVVDDNAQNRALAKETLEDEGYEVILATTGEDAIRAFEQHRPDCVLLDVRMPGMGGLTACARIRSLPGGADTPIVFLTALRDVDTFDHAVQAGADDFLTKPVRPSELLARIQSALKLRRMSAELREHYEIVRRQRDDLMRLQLQKERLTAFVVHDLKNPVSSMDLHAQVLLRDRDLPERAHDSARQIREEVRSLMRLLLNLLDISKSEEGQLAPKRADVNLQTLVTDVLNALEVRAQARRLVLKPAVIVEAVMADGDLLRRVIENLLDNAVRHAPENTEVRVSADRRGGEVEIRVADAGSGVPIELRERIFEKFAQLDGDGHTQGRTGRGLGLAFCKLAVEAHGGRIWVEDAIPGAVFCVRLPHDT
jgi:two-component system, sensor histidine kinase and response regulator